MYLALNAQKTPDAQVDLPSTQTQGTGIQSITLLPFTLATLLVRVRTLMDSSVRRATRM